jgi:hypothetical protein
MKNIFIIGIVFFMLSGFCINVQSQDSLKIKLKSDARQHFLEKNYKSALPLYLELLNAYPGEPEFQFATGVCLVSLNNDLPEAIRLLRAVSASDYSPLSWYYLGRAQHLYYSFEDAIKAYAKFMLKAKSAEIQQYHVERLIEMAKNGIDLTRTGLAVTVQSVRSVQMEQLNYAADINGSGKLMKKPMEFCSKTDIRNGYRPWMFLPSFTEVNEYVYVSGYETGKKNKQIFRIKNINHETWSFAESLDAVINTPYDEEFPYFDVKSSTLYFSSNGHSIMGGYDIFKSQYDWNSKSWSRPENLGFPINSPHDDFVYITDELNHSASFVSTRDVQPDQAVIYQIRLEKDTSGIRYLSVDDLRKASQLTVTEWKPEPLQNPVSASGLESDSILNQGNAEPKPTKSEYNIVLAQALMLQISADSAARITRDLRIQAKEEPDDSTKKQLISDILKNDKESKRIQRSADLKFAEAKKLKNIDILPGTNDSTVYFSREINGINIYQYNTESGLEPALEEVIVDSASKEAAVPEKIERTDKFFISVQPAYNDINPIPQGSVIDSGLVYRIQLGVFSKPKSNDAFGGIYPINYEQVKGGTVIKYYAGYFYALNNVVKALEIIRSKGFPDAFIVAFHNGNFISTEKAKEIEFAAFLP